MTAFASQITIRLADNRVLTPTAAERRVVAEAILRLAVDFPIIVFRIADTHIHIVVVGDLALAAELARRIEISFQRLFRPGVPSARAWVKPVDGQSHLANLFDYCLRQDKSHGTFVDPLHDGSNLPDLLGMRLVGRYTTQTVREHLPRVNRRKLLGYLGVDGLEPVAGPVSLLRESAQSAAAVGTLAGRGARQRAAKVSAVHLARGEATVAEVACALRVSIPTVERMARLEPDPRLARAIALQMDARRRLAHARVMASGAALYAPGLADDLLIKDSQALHYSPSSTTRPLERPSDLGEMACLPA